MQIYPAGFVVAEQVRPSAFRQAVEAHGWTYELYFVGDQLVIAVWPINQKRAA